MLDTALNWIIPPIVIICIVYWMYKLFLPMFKGLGGAVGGLWGKVKGEDNETNQRIKNITYE